MLQKIINIIATISENFVKGLLLLILYILSIFYNLIKFILKELFSVVKKSIGWLLFILIIVIILIFTIL